MKKPFAIPLTILMTSVLLTGTGCSLFGGNKEEETPVETTTSQLDVINQSFSTGSTTDKIYTIDFYSLSYLLPDGWTFLSDEQISQMTNNLQSSTDNSDIKNAIDAGETMFVMYANKGDKSQNVNISVQKVHYDTSVESGFSIDSYIDSSLTQLNETLPSQGFENLEAQKTNVRFLSEDVPGIKLKTKYKGLDVYETQVYMFKGSYIASITATSSGNDNTQAIIRNFYDPTKYTPQ